MSFHLAISTRRDPEDLTTPKRASGSSTIATLEISGVLSEDTVAELRERLQELLASSAETLVVELADVGAESERLALFVEWVTQTRAEGKPLHVAALQPDVYERLRSLAHDPEWLLPCTGAATAVNRRALTFDGPAAAT
jgi:ABC-type transporter Mla MlaB component